MCSVGTPAGDRFKGQKAYQKPCRPRLVVAFLCRRPRAQAALFGRIEWLAELAVPTSSRAEQNVRQEERNLAQDRSI